MNRNLRWSLLFIILVSSRVCSQSLHFAGLFPTIDHSAVFTDRWGYSIYYFGAFPIINLRIPDIGKDPNFLLFYSEQALTYSLSKKLSFTGSYVYQRANVVYKDYVNENRFYLQATYKHSFKKYNIKHRFRFDGRFIENRLLNKTSFTHRARYLIGVDFPIKSKKNNNYLTFYEELFFATSGKTAPFYEENWAYAAIGKKLNEKNKLELGILYITWKLAQNSWFNQYYLQFTWINYLNFKNKKE